MVDAFFTMMSSGWRQKLFLAVFCLFAFLPGIASLPPIDRDESRFVQATKQMMESGDYIDIRFQDEHRYKKPAGIYWLQTAAAKLTGQGVGADIWAYRLVSVAAGVSAVLTIASLGTFLFGPMAGLAAGLMMAGLFGLGFEARLAKTDATVLAMTLVSQAALARFYINSKMEMPTARFWWWAFWIANGVGILVKGPITPLVAGLTVAGIALFDRDRKWMRELKPLSGIAVLAVLVLPWFIAISIKSGAAFWSESVGKDMLGKVASGAESHGAPPGYYVLTYCLYMWPFALIAVNGGLKALNRFREPKLLFLLAWYVPFWLVLEATPTKLPHYPLPAYPALLLLGAWALFTEDGKDTVLETWQVWLSHLTLIGLAVMTVAFAGIAAFGVPWLTGSLSAAGILAAVFALAAGWLTSGMASAGQPISRIAGASVASVFMMGLFTSLVAPAIKPVWISPAIVLAFNAAKPCADSKLASVDYHEPSLVFLTGTATILTGINGGATHLAASAKCNVVVLPLELRSELQSLLPAGMNLLDIGMVEGINYSKGDPMKLLLVRIAP